MKFTLLSAPFATVAVPLTAPVAADAQRRDRDRDYRWHGDDNNWEPSRDYRRGNYRERRLSNNDQVYRGRDGRLDCKRNDGTTGLSLAALPAAWATWSAVARWARCSCRRRRAAGPLGRPQSRFGALPLISRPRLFEIGSARAIVVRADFQACGPPPARPRERLVQWERCQ
ncbi:hypothetical protein AB5I41_11835 [Sphingomonas sp. MMS24-JH45]